MRSKWASVMGWLTAPHWTVRSVGFVADDELVFGRTAGELAGADDERAVGGENAFAAVDGMLQQLRRVPDSSTQH